MNKTTLIISYKIETSKEINFGILRQIEGREKGLTLVIDTWILTANLVKKSIYSTAEFSYLSGRASERFNISHLNHGWCKIRAECWRALAVPSDDAVSRTSAEKYLIWLKKTLLLNEILEVIVIKRIGCHQIQGCNIVITIPTSSRTAASPGTSKASVNISSIVVYPIPECHTSCLAYRVGTYIPMNKLIFKLLYDENWNWNLF